MSSILRKYGVATDVYVPMIKAGVQDFAQAADWTPAAGDTKISKDGAALANLGSNPSHIGSGVWKFTFTATEMQAAKIFVAVVDSATKAVEDQAILIDTYGNASAEHAFDLDTATQSVSVASIGAGAITAAAIATDAIDADALADGAITAPTFAAGAIDATAIATGAIDNAAIATGAIDNTKFAAGAIDNAAIATDAIGAAEIAAGAIDSDAFTANALNAIADALLKRDFSAVTGEAARSMLNALRAVRNRWRIAGSTLTVYKEDDVTSAWTGAVTQAAANPTSEIDPT